MIQFLSPTHFRILTVDNHHLNTHSSIKKRLGATALASLGPCTSIFHLRCARHSPKLLDHTPVYIFTFTLHTHTQHTKSFNGFRSFSQSTATLTSQSLALGKRERVR